MKTKLGELIRRRRKALRLSQTELAGRLGVGRTHVAFMEIGQHKPSISLIKRLASTLELDARRCSCSLTPKPDSSSEDTRSGFSPSPTTRGEGSLTTAHCENYTGSLRANSRYFVR